MTTLLRASDSAEFLRIVPSLAGFTPRQSIVLLPFHRTRTHGAMRLDLPPNDVPLDEFADAAVGLIARVEGTDAVAVVVYTDDEAHATRDGLVLPHAVAVDELLGCAEEAGLRVVDALCVTPAGWAGYLHDEPELSELDEVVPEVPSVGDVSGDQLAGSDLPHVDLAEKERVGRALSELTALLEHDRHARSTSRENPTALAAISMLEDIPALFESVLQTPDELPAFVTAALLWCMDRPLFRDVAIAQWATGLVGGMRTLEAQLAFAERGEMVPEELGEVFLGRGAAPDLDRLRTALAVVRAAASRAPSAFRPAPLTAAAWLSWALGRSSHAGRYLDMAREIDPDYGLAALLDGMISSAMLPEWAFRTGSAE